MYYLCSAEWTVNEKLVRLPVCPILLVFLAVCHEVLDAIAVLVPPRLEDDFDHLVLFVVFIEGELLLYEIYTCALILILNCYLNLRDLAEINIAGTSYYIEYARVVHVNYQALLVRFNDLGLKGPTFTLVVYLVPVLLLPVVILNKAAELKNVIRGLENRLLYPVSVPLVIL